MKKLISLALSLVMILSSVVVFAAVDPANITEIADVPVEALVEISKDGDSYTDTLTVKNVTKFIEEYCLKATVNMEDVNNQLLTLSSYNTTAALDADVSGKFEITITFPNDTLQMDYYNNFEFYLDEESTDKVFGDFYVVPAKEDVLVDNNTLKFTVKLVDGLKGSDIFEVVNGQPVSLLGDAIYLVCNDVVKPRKLGTYKVVGEVEGYTDIVAEDESRAYHITYKFNDADATLILKGETKPGSTGGSSMPSGVIQPTTPAKPSEPVDNEHNVIFNIGSDANIDDDGAIDEIEDKLHANNSVVKLPEAEPTREGFVFQGWYANGKKVETEVKVTEDTVVSAKWINLTPAADLNAEEHEAYIKGYPDGDVRPEANITREEVATIFYRLLNDLKLNEIKTNENDFTDVKADRWSVNAISTLAKGGYIKGYEDGTFRPENNITRAEFVTIASRFISTTEGLKNYYNDVAGHWAEDYIALVSDQAWISGYEDGSFRPDNTITRAEVMKIVNSMLVRYTNKDNLTHEAVIFFPDNHESAWYYLDVIEATNGHDHERHEDGYNELWFDVETPEIID